MPMIVHLSSKELPTVFVFQPCASTDDEARQLDNEFYKFGKRPEGYHLELEIIHPSPDSVMWNDRGNFHIHNSKSGRPFVCWPFPIPNQEEAERIARIWSVGTAYTFQSKKSFIELFDKDPGNFFELMEKEHGIRVIQVIRVS